MSLENDSLRRSRLTGLLTAVLFLTAEMIARPFAAMGVSDDWSYILTAQKFAETGRIVYNGWATAIIGWQLLPAALFLKLFGTSYSVPRITTMLVATLTVFVMQRLFVRAGISNRNSTLGVLAFALSPIYMELSASFMTDIPGLFAIVLCLYACIRALQAAGESAATAWVVFAVVSNAVLGSSRQIAWLGVLVIVPCTLWLLRRSRQVLATGTLATFAGVIFIYLAMHWFAQQPYSITEKIMPPIHGLHTIVYMARQLGRGALEIFFLLLPIIIAFVPELRRRTWRFATFAVLFLLAYTVVGYEMMHHHSAGNLLEPLLGDWLGTHGHYDAVGLASESPVVLGTGVRIVLTALSTVATVALIAFLVRLFRSGTHALLPTAPKTTPNLSWHQLAVLTGPFALAYFALLVPRAASNLIDRYLLGLELVAAIFLLKAYQQFVRPALPSVTVVAIAVIGLFSVASLHDMFALYRARVALATELAAAGVPDYTIDGGFEHNSPVELERSATINDRRLQVPAGSFVVDDPYLGGESCDGKAIPHGAFPHYAPHYGLAFEANACGGATAYAPVRYFRWLALHSTSLYVVKYQAITERPAQP